MNYESGIFHFKGRRRMSSFFIFHLSGRTDQLVDSYQTRMAVGKKTKGRTRPPGAPHGGMALLFSRLGVRADGSASRPYPDE